MATASVVPYCFPYAIPLLTVLCHRTANPYWAFLPLLIVWVLVPVFDHFLSHGLTAPLARPDPELTARRSFRFVLYLWLPAQALFLLWAGRLAILPNTAALHRTALTLVAGLVSAEGINVAHELLHGTKSERRLGRLLLRFVCYGHFATEHVYGHHRRVATLADPASMRLGESFYKFLPRTVVGGFRSALGYETSRLRAAGRCPLGPENIVLVDIGVSAALLAFAFAFGGAGGARFFLAQAALAVVLLEQVNAIEHYGLTRVHRNGRLEPVGPQHAWDTHGPLSDFLMFRLQAHADHHMHAARLYQTLRPVPESPKLPAGYLALAPLLLIPPAWRAVMDPRLARYRAQCAEKERPRNGNLCDEDGEMQSTTSANDA